MSILGEERRTLKKSECVLNVERVMFWICHLAMVATLVSVVFREYLNSEYLSTQIFVAGVVLYTLTLAMSICFDKLDSSRVANDESARSLGSVLKPILFACLVVMLALSGLVIIIDVFVERAGIYF